MRGARGPGARRTSGGWERVSCFLLCSVLRFLLPRGVSKYAAGRRVDVWHPKSGPARICRVFDWVIWVAFALRHAPRDAKPVVRDSIVVTAKTAFRNLADVEAPDGLIGVADAASVGVVTAKEIAERPLQRPADVLESVPGVVVSQHSGEGKANQYYLRGFNLDHGTDLAQTVAGAPVNMPTNAHGQGYSDDNFVMPELIGAVQYRKGPYYADAGDF